MSLILDISANKQNILSKIAARAEKNECKSIGLRLNFFVQYGDPPFLYLVITVLPKKITFWNFLLFITVYSYVNEKVGVSSEMRKY